MCDNERGTPIPNVSAYTVLDPGYCLRCVASALTRRRLPVDVKSTASVGCRIRLYGIKARRRGGALGPSPRQRGPHPSRHGRLPLRSRRPACAAPATSWRRQRHHGGAQDPQCSSLGLDRRTPGRRHQERFASLRDGRCPLLTPTPRRYETACTRERGRSRQRGTITEHACRGSRGTRHISRSAAHEDDQARPARWN